MPGLPGEEGEGGGFFGFGGDAVGCSGGELAAERTEACGEHGHESLIARAATRDDVVDFSGFEFFADEGFVGVSDGVGGERGCGGERVLIAA